MSWLDDIVDFGSSVLDYGSQALNWLGGSGIGSSLAKTAILGYGLNQVTKSINQDNATKNTTSQPDPGVRLTLDASTDNKIPVVYGTAFVGGILTDAQLGNSNQTMFYVLTLCERTGVKMSDSVQSEISFEEIYLNDEKIVFESDGITVNSSVDRTGASNSAFNGLIKIYCYNNGGSNPVSPAGYSATLSNAHSIMPNWTLYNQMTNLVFAIIRVDYNKEKNVTGLGKLQFKLKNTMTLPGDCLYDMLTNTVYGAAIDPTEVFSS
jgi:hypothetical protein